MRQMNSVARRRVVAEPSALRRAARRLRAQRGAVDGTRFDQHAGSFERAAPCGLEGAPVAGKGDQQGAVGMRQVRQVLQRGLQALAEKFAVEAKILQRHFMDGELIQTIAHQLSMAEGTVYNKQSEAITRLAEILYALEQRTLTDYHCALDARLNPPSNTNLVGIETPLTHLVDLLCTPGAPWIVALAGLGGIGKTTLADAVARRAIRRAVFDDVGDINIGALHVDRFQKLIQESARSADKGATPFGFLLAGRFADKHDLGVQLAFADHRCVLMRLPIGEERRCFQTAHFFR